MHPADLSPFEAVKRYLINAAQMSFAVSLGLLLSPVVMSVHYSIVHLMRRA